MSLALPVPRSPPLSPSIGPRSSLLQPSLLYPRSFAVLLTPPPSFATDLSPPSWHPSVLSLTRSLVNRPTPLHDHCFDPSPLFSDWLSHFPVYRSSHLNNTHFETLYPCPLPQTSRRRPLLTLFAAASNLLLSLSNHSPGLQSLLFTTSYTTASLHLQPF